MACCGNEYVFINIGGEMFFTISGVAAKLDVPQDMVRFWGSKFFRVRSLKRGGVRLYYRSEDVMLLRLVHDLLYFDGYSVRGVQNLLREARREPVIEVEPRPKMNAEIIQWTGGSHGTRTPAEGARAVALTHSAAMPPGSSK